jgi:hypothetical protein
MPYAKLPDFRKDGRFELAALISVKLLGMPKRQKNSVTTCLVTSAAVCTGFAYASAHLVIATDD